MNKRMIYLSLSMGAFLLFVFFSYLVHKNHFTQFDFDMTVRLQDHISRRFDTFFSFLSTVGRAEVVGIILLVICFVYRKWTGVIILFSFGAFHLFEVYGKTFVDHLPPPHFMLRTQQLIAMPQYYVSPENSYPSGHAARAIFLTTIVFLLVGNSRRFSRIQKLIVLSLLILYDLAMLISRPYLGEHWTSDVIGGTLLGFAFAIFYGVFI